MHNFMKENMDNLQSLIIKDMISAQNGSKRKEAKHSIFTNEDLDQFCENLMVEQFKSSTEQENESNVDKLQGLLEIAMTEIICSKASMQLRKITPEKQLAKLKIIT